MASSITSLMSFFKEDRKSTDRGENLVKSDHVEAFSYSSGVIRGKIQASMKQKSYKVTISSNTLVCILFCIVALFDLTKSLKTLFFVISH